MTDHAGGLRRNLAGPVRAMVRNRRHRLDEDKGSPGYILKDSRDTFVAPQELGAAICK